jgi:hypothetical protein
MIIVQEISTRSRVPGCRAPAAVSTLKQVSNSHACTLAAHAESSAGQALEQWINVHSPHPSSRSPAPDAHTSFLFQVHGADSWDSGRHLLQAPGPLAPGNAEAVRAAAEPGPPAPALSAADSYKPPAGVPAAVAYFPLQSAHTCTVQRHAQW